MDVVKVSDAIDKLLDRPHWSRKELVFYQMLISKVKQYQGRASTGAATDSPSIHPRPVKDLSSDIRDIGHNISSQKWYKKSNNQGTISGLIQGMRLAECQHRGQPDSHDYHYRIDLVLSNNVHLVMDIANDSRAILAPPYHFRVYFEYNSTKGHIAAYKPEGSKGHTLPEYDSLTRMFSGLERHEIICLAIELVIYYDVDEIMVKMPIGNNYPITLAKLMKGILQNL